MSWIAVLAMLWPGAIRAAELRLTIVPHEQKPGRYVLQLTNSSPSPITLVAARSYDRNEKTIQLTLATKSILSTGQPREITVPYFIVEAWSEKKASMIVVHPAEAASRSHEDIRWGIKTFVLAAGASYRCEAAFAEPPAGARLICLPDVTRDRPMVVLWKKSATSAAAPKSDSPR